jgi:Zn-dependent protease
MSTFLNPTFIIAILVALSVHECAHGYVAGKLGDPTAWNAGRVTLNPIAHLDPLGALLFLIVGFGWGKPVPVNPMYFSHPKRDTAIVSLAGPVSNLLLAALSFIVLMLILPQHLSSTWDALTPVSGPVWLQFLTSLFGGLLFINLGLMAFNLIPIAPLDGSKVLQAFIPLRQEEAYERFMRVGPYILLGILLAENLLHVPLLTGWFSFVMDGVLRIFGVLFGWI